MATWQPNYRAGASALIMRLHNEHHVSHPPGYSARKCNEDSRHTVSEVLWESGALSEINRLTALLEMKNETINTLRTQLHKATATFADDYDSGYRAA